MIRFQNDDNFQFHKTMHNVIVTWLADRPEVDRVPGSTEPCYSRKTRNWSGNRDNTAETLLERGNRMIVLLLWNSAAGTRQWSYWRWFSLWWWIFLVRLVQRKIVARGSNSSRWLLGKLPGVYTRLVLRSQLRGGRSKLEFRWLLVS